MDISRYGYHTGYTCCLIDQTATKIPSADKLDASSELERYIGNDGFVRHMIDGCTHIIGCCIVAMAENELLDSPVYTRLHTLSATIEQGLSSVVNAKKLHPLAHRTLSGLLSDVIAVCDNITSKLDQLRREYHR
jgi:hypothetical protein